MDNSPAKNADRELWRCRPQPDDYYADSIHVTEGGGIGINCGGTVYVKPLREWHRLAALETVAANLRTFNRLLKEETSELRGRLQAALDNLALANETARVLRHRIDGMAGEVSELRADLAAAVEREAALKQRLAKLDALLASETVPEGLCKAVWQHPDEGHTEVAAWRWFRERLGAPIKPRIGSKEWEQRALERGWKPEPKRGMLVIDDTAPEQEPDPELLARHAAKVEELKDDARFVAKDPTDQPKADVLSWLVAATVKAMAAAPPASFTTSWREAAPGETTLNILGPGIVLEFLAMDEDGNFFWRLKRGAPPTAD